MTGAAFLAAHGPDPLGGQSEGEGTVTYPISTEPEGPITDDNGDELEHGEPDRPPRTRCEAALLGRHCDLRELRTGESAPGTCTTTIASSLLPSGRR